MNIDNLEAFVFVHHFGSINQAAKALFLSQPSVTYRIQSLERALDVQLFERVGRKVKMTDEAKEFLPYAMATIESYKNGKKRLQEKAITDQSEPFIIGCTALVSNYFLPHVLPKWNLSYPDVHIKLLTGTTDSIVTKLLNREVDIGFVHSSSHPMIESSLVFESPICLFVQADHPFQQMENVDGKALANQPIVLLECSSLDWSFIQHVFEQDLPIRAYEVDSFEAAKALMLNHAGIGFLPELCVRKEVASGELVRIDIPSVSNGLIQTNMIRYRGANIPYADHLFERAKLEGEKRINI